MLLTLNFGIQGINNSKQKCKKVYKTVISDVVADLKPQKFTVSSDL